MGAEGGAALRGTEQREALNCQPRRRPREKRLAALRGCRVRNKPLAHGACTGAQMKENQRR